jgi:hypothetical protein
MVLRDPSSGLEGRSSGRTIGHAEKQARHRSRHTGPSADCATQRRSKKCSLTRPLTEKPLRIVCINRVEASNIVYYRLDIALEI